MKCWRCGADGDESVVKCPSCGADLMRKEPASEIGKAMRMLYDRYGAEKISKKFTGRRDWSVGRQEY